MAPSTAGSETMSNGDDINEKVRQRVEEEKERYGDTFEAPPGDTPLKILRSCLLAEGELLNLTLPERLVYLGPWRAGNLGMIYGPRGIGKTLFGFAFGLSISRGLALGPWDAGIPTGVIYVDAEMPLDQEQSRLRRMVKGLPPALAPFAILSNEYLHLSGKPTINLLDEAWRDGFSEFMKENRGTYGVLILDNLSSLMPGCKENEKESWDAINAWLIGLRFLGIMVVVIHHAGKSGDQRGTSGREDALDMVVKLTRPAGYSPDQGARFDVTFTKARGVTGTAAVPFQFQVTEHPTDPDRLVWMTETMKGSSRDIIIAMLGAGIPQKDISAILGKDPAYISRVKAGAIRDGFLKKGNAFTGKGKEKYGGIDLSQYWSC